LLAGYSYLCMSEVELHVVCKHCGAEVSPYITECPYCGNRLRKRAPKLESRGEELAPKERKSFFARFRRDPRAKGRDATPLVWLSEARPYGTAALLLATGVVYVVNKMGALGFFDLGAIVGPISNDFWRLITAQFNYSNLGYLFAVGIATAIFGTALERRYNALVPIATFLVCGAAGMYLASELETAHPITIAVPSLAQIHVPIALGGNGSALGLLAAWTVRDWRDRRAGENTETDLLGVAVIAVVLALMPLIDDFASWWVALGGLAVGAAIGLILPSRR
jgi:membrane associated rhomboid family serine protease